jgi:hypothetical protein
MTDAQDAGADNPWRKVLAETYLAMLENKESPVMERMLGTFQKCQDEAAGDLSLLEHLVGERIVAGDEKMADLARRAIRLWYLGAWFDNEPPCIRAWPNIYPASAFVSSQAYYRALAYPAGQSHAPGNNLFDPVYGSWSSDPEAGIGPPTWPDGGDASDSETS